ncbi:uncharacterized protein LOC126377894 isoform X2 [Pectinophora gossypiella]|uniref:uncharacterized protein LOC126377894 isoform X2 n=1 Tax=Pectinophora gossypiella TaxID=13191 RepID=UPI00214DFDAF|nr:uncharacterized protein LOC126377894 isoform X2 [Pectinophora gossypiella]
MHPLTFLALAAVATVALAGQYYVPRAYYTIDAEGHESIPVPLRRLRRSPIPYPNPPPLDNSWSNAASGSSSWSNANSGSNGGYRPPPQNGYGSAAPSFGLGNVPSGSKIVSASASTGLDSNGQGYYGTRVTYGIVP